jgi:hypothetical protein
MVARLFWSGEVSDRLSVRPDFPLAIFVELNSPQFWSGNVIKQFLCDNVFSMYNNHAEGAVGGQDIEHHAEGDPPRDSTSKGSGDHVKKSSGGLIGLMDPFDFAFFFHRE